MIDVQISFRFVSFYFTSNYFLLTLSLVLCLSHLTKFNMVFNCNCDYISAREVFVYVKCECVFFKKIEAYFLALWRCSFCCMLFLLSKFSCVCVGNAEFRKFSGIILNWGYKISLYKEKYMKYERMKEYCNQQNFIFYCFFFRFFMILFNPVVSVM